ncbi:IclR family transcriptional regulator C-terminal domain-containing protein [Tepidibacillus marianensis]|uniref:IclR family transcriptional regulator n=1 Tax=Tepidibacillus marianensis TaxID=3131995 RepID=UPI0030CFD6CB
MFGISRQHGGKNDPAVLFLPEMQSLRDNIGETVSLYIIDGYERLRIQSVESQLPIRRVAPVGARMPLSVGASSKVLTCYSNPHEQEMIFQHLKIKEQIDLVQYKKQLTKVKANGYATSFEEREPGTSALSIPILNRSGEILSALTISGPINRFTYRRIKEIVPILEESQKRLNRLILF